VINGTDNTAATPALTGTDTDTGVFFPAANTMAFSTGGTEKMRVESSGNLNFTGTAQRITGDFSNATASNRVAFQSSTTNGATTIEVIPNGTGTSTGLFLESDSTITNSSALGLSLVGGTDARIQSLIRGSGTFLPMTFYTNGAERLRIDTSGNLLVGTTSATGKFTVSGNASASRVAAVMSNTASDAGSGPLLVSKFDNTTTTSQVFVQFAVNNNSVASGQINANGASSAAFGSYSDSRLKQNIADLPPQLANIMALRPVEFDYIESEGGGHQIGFVAQEVKNVYPDLVGERADGMLTLTDLNKNDSRLIKAIQELKAIVDAQAARIAALEGAAL
jgi:hypothetical protein